MPKDRDLETMMAGIPYGKPFPEAQPKMKVTYAQCPLLRTFALDSLHTFSTRASCFALVLHSV